MRAPAGAVLQEVLQAPRRRDNHLDALAQRGRLRPLGHAAVDAQRAHAYFGAGLLEDGRDLLRQLARRRQHQGGRALA